MRKTSQDGVDASFVTSGVENEIKMPSLSLLKLRKSSLKRKPPSSLPETDETVNEPLLSKEPKPGSSKMPATNFFTKMKPDADRGELVNNDNIQKASSTVTSAPVVTSPKEPPQPVTKTTSSVSAPLHNHMNTNVFNSPNTSASVAPKSQILVEIDSTKPSGYSPSPLIFTTAKIHADSKSNHMEPVQVTPVPILSTVEMSISKGGNIKTNEKKVPTANGAPIMNTVYTPSAIDKKDDKSNTNQNRVVNPLSFDNKAIGNSISSCQSKFPVSTAIDSLSINFPSINKQENHTNVQKPQNERKAETLTLDQINSNVPVKTLELANEQIISTVANVAQADSFNQNGKSVANKSKPINMELRDTKTSSLQEANKINTNSPLTFSKEPPKVLCDSKTDIGSTSKQFQRQKNAEELPPLKNKITDTIIPNKVDNTNDSSAKIVSTFNKQPTKMPTNANNSNISNESDKIIKPCANDIKTPKPNSTATSSNNKINVPAVKSTTPASVTNSDGTKYLVNKPLSTQSGTKVTSNENSDTNTSNVSVTVTASSTSIIKIPPTITTITTTVPTKITTPTATKVPTTSALVTSTKVPSGITIQTISTKPKEVNATKPPLIETTVTTTKALPAAPKVTATKTPSTATTVPSSKAMSALPTVTSTASIKSTTAISSKVSSAIPKTTSIPPVKSNTHSKVSSVISTTTSTPTTKSTTSSKISSAIPTTTTALTAKSTTSSKESSAIPTTTSTPTTKSTTIAAKSSTKSSNPKTIPPTSPIPLSSTKSVTATTKLPPTSTTANSAKTVLTQAKLKSPVSTAPLTTKQSIPSTGKNTTKTQVSTSTSNKSSSNAGTANTSKSDNSSKPEGNSSVVTPTLSTNGIAKQGVIKNSTKSTDHSKDDKVSKA